MEKMPFGLCNAPSTYQRLISIVLRNLISRICPAYLDDVIVFSRRLTPHLDDLRAVFTRILGAGLKLKPSKCQRFRNEVLYLGHIINTSGVAPDPDKLRVFSTWPVPATVCDVQSFLGFVNFYGDYIAGSTRLTAPIYALTAGRKSTEKVVLDAEELIAFNSLKQALVAGHRLAYPDLSKQFIVHTDASNIAIGAVLLQRSDESVKGLIDDGDRLELCTHWLYEQRADPTISRVVHHVVAKTKPDDVEIQLNPAIQSYVKFWNSLVVENGLLRHVNGNRYSSRVTVPSNLREGVVSALHLPSHHGF